MEPNAADASVLIVRTLTSDDLSELVRMDERITSRTRQSYYQGRLHNALQMSQLQISLGAELDGHLVGAILGTLQYGEFGVAEAVAVLDTVLVDPARRGQGVGSALFDQLELNLGALNVERMRTEVAWDEHNLTHFLARRGFGPVPRLVLERSL